LPIHLVGLQRESAASPLAGVRTFPLVTVLGTVCGLLAHAFGGWILAAGIIALVVIIYVEKIIEMSKGHPDQGITTEVALLLMFAVGAYLVVGDRAAAIAIGGGAAVLLHFKGELHGIVAKLGANDLKAIMQFALISLVILPVLPNRCRSSDNSLKFFTIFYEVQLMLESQKIRQVENSEPNRCHDPIWLPLRGSEVPLSRRLHTWLLPSTHAPVGS
jgi:hypothetical protein